MDGSFGGHGQLQLRAGRDAFFVDRCLSIALVQLGGRAKLPLIVLIATTKWSGSVAAPLENRPIVKRTSAGGFLSFPL